MTMEYLINSKIHKRIVLKNEIYSDLCIFKKLEGYLNL